MTVMRFLTVTAFVAEAVRLDDMAQGSAFTQCLLIGDWERRTLQDDITLQDRDSSGCCPVGTIPGGWLEDGYHAGQIVCGFSNDGSVSRTMGSEGGCTYGACYMYKQNYPCEDGSTQRINGCCGVGYARLNFQPDYDCSGNSLSSLNIFGEKIEYCSTYHSNYEACGNEGTESDSDDVTSNGGVMSLVPANIFERPACRSGGCFGQ